MKFELRTSERDDIENKTNLKDVIVNLKYRLKKTTLNIDIKIIIQLLFKHTNINYRYSMFNQH